MSKPGPRYSITTTRPDRTRIRSATTRQHRIAAAPHRCRQPPPGARRKARRSKLPAATQRRLQSMWFRHGPTRDRRRKIPEAREPRHDARRDHSSCARPTRRSRRLFDHRPDRRAHARFAHQRQSLRRGLPYRARFRRRQASGLFGVPDLPDDAVDGRPLRLQRGPAATGGGAPRRGASMSLPDATVRTGRRSDRNGQPAGTRTGAS